MWVPLWNCAAGLCAYDTIEQPSYIQQLTVIHFSGHPLARALSVIDEALNTEEDEQT